MNKKSLCALVSLACITAGAATNYDLLGRKASKMNSPMVYKDVEHKAVKKNTLQENDLLAVQSFKNSTSVEGGHNPDNNGADIYDNYLKVSNNGSTVYDSYSDYFYQYKNNLNKYFNPRIESNRNPSSYSHIATNRENTPYNATFYTLNESNYESLKSSYSTTTFLKMSPSETLRSYLGYGYGFDWWFAQTYGCETSTCDKVGMYITTKGRPAKLGANDNAKYLAIYAPGYDANSTCINKDVEPGYEREASVMNSAMAKMSGATVPFILNVACGGLSYPENPENSYPQIYMGLHAHNTGTSSGQYNQTTRKFDNYIYENQTVEIVGAGNSGKSSNGAMVPEAYAANAITVGAVDENRNMLEHSSWGNPSYGTQKPEIAQYGNFYLSDNNYNMKKYSNSIQSELYPNLDGTTGAATFTAAMVSDLLSIEPYYRWHPEAVKARLLTSSIKQINNDIHASGAKGVPTYRSLFGASSKTIKYYHSSYFWNGNIAEMFTKINQSGKTRYERKINLHVTEGYSYRIAITWLSNGDDIYELGKIPQDFDLSLMKGSSTVTSSTSSSNAYELVTFKATNTEDLTIKVLLYDDATATSNPRHNKIKLGLDVLEYKDPTLNI